METMRRIPPFGDDRTPVRPVDDAEEPVLLKNRR